ncbi:hypothetical protein C8R44DRAFT_889827 [Mycena epipterygia]|nr:hypothetical protein C8R44DRAFT_889827 [Mycena epipterygia]
MDARNFAGCVEFLGGAEVLFYWWLNKAHGFPMVVNRWVIQIISEGVLIPG